MNIKLKSYSAAGLIFLFVFTIGCKSTKTASQSDKSETTTTINDALMIAAQNRYSGITAAEITEGQRLYYSKCGNCHGLPEITSESDAKWPKIMDWMAPKAGMDEAQKKKTLQFVLSMYDVSKKK